MQAQRCAHLPLSSKVSGPPSPGPDAFLHTPPCMYLLGSGLSVEPPTKTCVVGWVVAIPYVFAQKRMIRNFIL